MERRSFFSTIAGLVFGASRVNPRPSPASVLPEPPPEPQEAPGPEDFSPSPPTHMDPAAMFADIRKFVDSHPGAVVLSADDPMSLLLGYSAFVGPRAGYDEVSSVFTLRVTSLRGYGGRERGMISTAAGRRQLAADLMRGTI